MSATASCLTFAKGADDYTHKWLLTPDPASESRIGDVLPVIQNVTFVQGCGFMIFSQLIFRSERFMGVDYSKGCLLQYSRKLQQIQSEKLWAGTQVFIPGNGKVFCTSKMASQWPNGISRGLGRGISYTNKLTLWKDSRVSVFKGF